MLNISSDNHVWVRDDRGIYYCQNCGLPQKPEGVTKPPPPCKKRSITVYFEDQNQTKENK